MSLIHEQYFESGTDSPPTNWGEVVDTNCDVVWNESVPGSPPPGMGDYCISCTVADATDNYANARCTVSLGTPRATNYWSFYFYIETEGLGSGNYFKLFQANDTSVRHRVYIKDSDGAGNLQVRMDHYHDGGLIVGSWTNNVAEDTWYFCKCSYDATSASVDIWSCDNGVYTKVITISASGYSTGASPDQCYMMVNEHTGSSTTKVYFDAFRWATTENSLRIYHDATSPTPPEGTECSRFEVLPGDTNASIERARVSAPTSYLHQYLYVDFVGLADTEEFKTLQVLDSSDNVAAYIRIYDDSGTLKYDFYCYDGSLAAKVTGQTLSLQGWYEFEYKYDIDGEAWELRLDGTSVGNGSITGATRTPRKVRTGIIGCTGSSTTRVYIDKVVWRTDTWTGVSKLHTSLDSLISKTIIGGKTDLDALLNRTIPIHTSLDSLISKTIIGGKTDLDALLTHVFFKNCQLDAFISKHVSSKTLLDALVNKDSQTISTLIDGYLAVVGSKNLSLDAFLSSLGIETSVSVDSLVNKSGVSESAVVDALVSAKDTTLLSVIDGLVQQAGVVSTLDVDALLRKSQIKTTVADALLSEKDVTKQTTVDAVIAKYVLKRTVLDALVHGVVVANTTVDALVKEFDKTLIAKLDAVLSVRGSVNLTLDAVLQSVNQRMAVLDAVLLGTVSKYSTVDGILTRMGVVKNCLLHAILGRFVLQHTLLDALVKRADTSDVLLDAYVYRLRSAHSVLDAILYRDTFRSISTELDALISVSETQAVWLDAVLMKGQVSFATLDSIVAYKLTRSVDMDSLLRGEVTSTSLMDAIIYSALAEAVSRYTFSSDLSAAAFSSELMGKNFSCEQQRSAFSSSLTRQAFSVQ